MGNLYAQNKGQGDFFVAKLDSTSKVVKTLQLGTNMGEGVTSLAVKNGIVYVAVNSTGSLAGTNPAIGKYDIVIYKLNSECNVIGKQQLGSIALQFHPCLS